jgi:gamma-glutamyltranspeptidase/glutathione hydrolase
MSFGIMGGDMQPQAHMQTVVRMLDYKQQPQAACDAPRWRYSTGIVNAEAGFDAAAAQGLRDLGHAVQPFADSYQDYGAGQFIWRLDEGQGDVAQDGYAAASDPRRDGQAAGY